MHWLVQFSTKKWLETHKELEDQIEAMVGSSDSNSSGRTFHPKNRVHTAIKDGTIATLRNDEVPGVKLAAPV
jgi:hypothetical protein